MGDQPVSPIPDGPFYRALEETKREEREAEGNRPTAAGTRLRASESLMCARAIGLRVLGVPESDPIPAEVLMAFEVGQNTHDVMQQILVNKFGATLEHVVDWSEYGFEMSCHADGMTAQTAFEIKSVSGYGYLVATGMRKSDEGPGPKAEHVVQVGMSAVNPDTNCEYVHLIYFDKDKNGIAEWIFNVDMPLPGKYGDMSIRDLVMAELTRQTGILGRIDSGMIPLRHIPGWGRVEIVADPNSRDQPWNCRYCRYNKICKDMPTDPFPIAELEISVGNATAEGNVPPA